MGSRAHLLTLVLFIFSACTQSPPTPPATSPHPLRILFIGNSLTYTNNLPAMLQKMAVAESPPLQCDAITFPAATLDFHKFTGISHRQLRTHPYDLVILQDYSTRPLTHPEATTASLQWFLQDIHTSNPKSPTTLLFENWPRANQWNSAPKLFQNYHQIHSTTGIPLLPIGEAWQRARSQLPWFHPYLDDRHPTEMATYLTACVLFHSIYDHPAPTEFIPPSLTPTQARALIQIATDPTPATTP